VSWIYSKDFEKEINMRSKGFFQRGHLGAVVVAGMLAILAVAPARAQISVIVSASWNVDATESQIVDMFVGAATTWSDGTKVQIVDQPDTPEGVKFYSDFLRQSSAQVRTQWTRLVLSGQAAAPKKAGGGAAVKQQVLASPGSIGYIATSELDATVKEITRVP
jgi:ABC-type phosphate transport system substrate-binding protein